jgi:ElaB/YqjD/DUF883 family membrane-anchored ribosome-binding protein
MRDKATFTDNKDTLLKDFQSLVSDTEKLLQSSASLAGDQAEELREHIRTTLSRARDSLHQAEGALSKQGKVAVQATETYVQSHPWQSLGISAAIGLLLGMLITRR